MCAVLDAKKVSQNPDIPIKFVKENVNTLCDFDCASFNSSVKTSKLSGNFKLADINPLYKKFKKI